MKVYIVIQDSVIQKVFRDEMEADKYIVQNGQVGYDKIIMNLT